MPDNRLTFNGITRRPRVDVAGVYYNKIPRLSDLASIAEPAVVEDAIDRSSFSIEPARTPLDEMVEKILENLSDKLLRLKAAPKKDDIVKKPLAKLIVKRKLADEKKNVLEAKLAKEGLTGLLIQATNKLNVSLSDVNRQVLSREGLLMYTAYRAAIGLDVRKDVDGLNANILDSIDLVRSYVNARLVEEVIKKHNLKNDDGQVKKLKEKLEKAVISYRPGEVEQVIIAEYEKLSEQGDLIDLVNEFLDSDDIDLPFGVDKRRVAEKMVEYLEAIGFDPDVEDPIISIINEEVEEINKSIDEKVNELKNLLLDELERVRKDLQDQLDFLNTNLSGATDNFDDRLSTATTERTNLKTQLDELKEKVDQLATGPDSVQLVIISGIDDDAALKLYDKGIVTIAKLATQTQQRLKTTLGISAEEAKYILQQAKALKAGDTEKFKTLLDNPPQGLV